MLHSSVIPENIQDVYDAFPEILEKRITGSFTYKISILKYEYFFEIFLEDKKFPEKSIKIIFSGENKETICAVWNNTNHFVPAGSGVYRNATLQEGPRVFVWHLIGYAYSKASNTKSAYYPIDSQGIKRQGKMLLNTEIKRDG